MGQNSLQLLKEPEFALDIECKSIFLEDFFEQLKGELVMDSHLEGRIKHPEGFIRLQGSDFDLGVQKISEIKAYAKLDGQKVKVDQLEVFLSPDDIIQGTGWFSFEKEYEFALSSPEIDLIYLDLIKEQDIAKGKGRLEISGKGTLPDVEISGEIRLSDLAVQGKNIDDFFVTLEVKDQLVKTMANIPGVGLKGEYHLTKKDLAASLELYEADLGIYFNIAGRPDYSGNATGTLNVYGNISDVDNLQGAAEFSKLDIFYKEKRFLFSKNVSADLKEKKLSIPGIHFTVFQEEGVKEGSLNIKGEGRLDGDLDFLINGHFPLQLVSLFVEDIYDFDGGLLLSANIAGTRHKPDIRADIELQDVAFTIPNLYQKLHKTNGQVKITSDAIVIDKVEGQVDTGKFNLNGKIELDALRPSGVFAKFAASSLPVNIPDTLDLIINTELTMQGTTDNTRLQGEVVLLEGEYYKDFNINLSMFREVIQKRREEKPLRSKITWAFLKNAALDIYVRYRNPFVVNNNIAQLDITPDLRIEGSLNNPVIKGRAQLESGTVTYQRKTFVVDRGVLYFLNPQTNEPTVDIQSHAKIKHYTIRLGISGTPNNLIFKPEGWDDDTNEKLTHEDIVSLIMFGTTSLERIQGEGGVLQSSSQMLSKLISTTFGEDIKQATGLDILEIESSAEDSSTDSDNIKVTIGKDLSRRMTLKYAVETKEGGSNQQTIAEYKFLEYILLNGFQDTEGNFGTELQFKLEFR
jgi:translocation and assembly module TamB